MDANKYFQILHMISAGGQKVCRKFLIGKGFSEAMIYACAENGYIIQIGTNYLDDPLYIITDAGRVKRDERDLK